MFEDLTKQLIISRIKRGNLLDERNYRNGLSVAKAEKNLISRSNFKLEIVTGARVVIFEYDIRCFFRLLCIEIQMVFAIALFFIRYRFIN